MFVFGKYRYGIHNTSGKQVIVILEKHTKIEIEIFFSRYYSVLPKTAILGRRIVAAILPILPEE